MKLGENRWMWILSIEFSYVYRVYNVKKMLIVLNYAYSPCEHAKLKSPQTTNHLY